MTFVKWENDNSFTANHSKCVSIQKCFRGPSRHLHSHHSQLIIHFASITARNDLQITSDKIIPRQYSQMFSEAILLRYLEAQGHRQDCFTDMNPPNSPFNPAAPIFRPPLRQHQHSPPRRGYHEARGPHTPPVSGLDDRGATPTMPGQQDNRPSSTAVSHQGNRGSENESFRRRMTQCQPRGFAKSMRGYRGRPSQP